LPVRPFLIADLAAPTMEAARALPVRPFLIHRSTL
jgi:hypothetical protein